MHMPMATAHCLTGKHIGKTILLFWAGERDGGLSFSTTRLVPYGRSIPLAAKKHPSNHQAEHRHALPASTILKVSPLRRPWKLRVLTKHSGVDTDSTDFVHGTISICLRHRHELIGYNAPRQAFHAL